MWFFEGIHGNNKGVIYAIAILVIILFAVFYFVFKPKVREVYSRSIASFDDYSFCAKQYVKSLPLPKKSGAKLNANIYVVGIKNTFRLLKMPRYKEVFSDIAKLQSRVKTALEYNFEALENLPAIDGVPRVLKIAEFCLEKSKYQFDGERVAAIINQQNYFRTLCFDEILSLNSAFVFVLTKRMAFIMQDVKTVLKMKRIADKIVKSKLSLSDVKAQNELKNSKLFLSFCSKDGLNSDVCKKAKEEWIVKTVRNMLSALENIDVFKRIDFSEFYAPIKIFCKYEAFEEAGESEKRGFLSLVKNLSDKENIDEFLFAIRIDNYIKSASGGHVKVSRIKLLNHSISSLILKKDISMLAAGLTSKPMMTLLFGCNNRGKNNECAQKNGVFDNTYEKLNKFKSVNLGISTNNNRLKAFPRLPREIVAADLKLSHNGVLHDIHLRRGEEKEIYLGKTKLLGTSEIYLNNTPLDVTYIIPKDEF